MEAVTKELFNEQNKFSRVAEIVLWLSAAD